MMKNLLAQAHKVDTPISGFGNYEPPAGETGPAGAASAVELIISNVLVVLTIVAGIAFTLYFLIGALNWVTAGGKQDKVDKAKMYMTNGAVGLIIVAVSYSIAFIISKVLGIDILEPAEMISKFIKVS